MEDGERLRVEVLGPLRAFAGGREIGLGAPKQRALFAALAMCADTVVGRGELIDRVWGRTSDDRRRESAHVRLRAPTELVRAR